jgi:hypothetical protein
MKTIWSLIVVIVLSFFVFYGLSITGEKIAINHKLSNESIDQLAVVNENINAYKNNITSQINPELNPDPKSELTGVDAYVQEYKDSKSKIDSLKEILYLAPKIPDVILIIIPFVEPEDLGVYIYVFRGVMWILILLMIYVAIRQGEVFNK